VSALRDERGLRPDVSRDAEPQVVGLAPQTTMMTERALTMKTYILRDPKTVEAQNKIPLLPRERAGEADVPNFVQVRSPPRSIGSTENIEELKI
jgi:hypothetical protein